jgi:predicted MFS family arabinose efflux permease
VLLLAATPAQMGILDALAGMATLTVSLIAGVWVDRLRRRPILIATDLARAAILITIPIVAVFGRLSMAQLYVVAALTGTFAVFYNLADRSFLPTLVSREALVEANSKIGVSDSLAEIAGPSLGGVLVQWLNPPLAILIDALSYVFSAACARLIRVVEPPPAAPATRQPVMQEIREGIQILANQPILRALAGSLGTINFFGSFIGALYWLFLVRELDLPPALVGVSIGVGGAGALLGALIAGRLTQQFGQGRILLATMLLWGAFAFVIPLAYWRGPWLAPIVMATQLLGDIPIAIYLINEVSLRQSIIPDRLLGRANASIEFVSQGMAPLGALAGGVLGETIGVRPTLLVAAIGIALASLWIFLSPIPRLARAGVASPEALT